MVLDSEDPILRRATDKPDDAATGMWTLFAVMAAVAVTLLIASADRAVQTAAHMPGVVAKTPFTSAPLPTSIQ
jgi:hypothetical protein